MATRLRPCGSCARHVRVSDAACPFCGSAIVAEVVGGALPSTGRVLSRAAAVFFGATTLAACVGGPGEPSSSSSSSGSSGSSGASSSGSSGNSSGSSGTSSSGSSGNTSSGTSGDPIPDPVPAYGPAPFDGG